MTDQVIEPFDNNTGDPSKGTSNPFEDKLKVIVGAEGNPKYEDVDTALDALAHSQAHIKTLEDERRSSKEEIEKMREELANRATVEDFVNKISPQEPNKVVETQDKVVGLDEEKVAEIISNTFSKREQEASKVNNLNTVVKVLKESFGDKANTVVSDKAKELGMSVTELQEMASEKPNVVLGLFKNLDLTKTKTITPSHNSSRKPDDKELPSDLMKFGISSNELRTGWNEIGRSVKGKYGIDE